MRYADNRVIAEEALAVRGYAWSWYCHIVAFPIWIIACVWLGYVRAILIRRTICARRGHVWMPVQTHPYVSTAPSTSIFHEECTWCHENKLRIYEVAIA